MIRSLNQAMWVMFGYTKEELMGRNIKILMTHPHSEMHDTYLKRYFRTHKKRIIGTARTLKARHKVSQPQPSLLRHTNLTTDGVNVGRVFVLYEPGGERVHGGGRTHVRRQNHSRAVPAR